MKVGQTVQVRRKGQPWATWQDFRITAIGDRGMLGYMDKAGQWELWVNDRSHDWKEEDATQ